MDFNKNTNINNSSNSIDEFWNNDFIIDLNDEYQKYIDHSDIVESDISKSEISESDITESDLSGSDDYYNYKYDLKNRKKNKVEKIKSLNDIEIHIKDNESIKKLNLNMSKDKKMSLLIIVLLQIIFGKNNSNLNKICNFLSLNDLLDKEVIANDYNGLIKNLSSMLNNSDTKSKNINKKSNHDEMVIHSNVNIDKIINFVKTTIFENSTENFINNFTDNHLSLSKLNETLQTNLINSSNKYRTNFNQIKLLGQGAYGSVYKVFHKYERKFYAVKKVFITKDLIKENYDIFREIQIYSELENKHIVRYYGSWIDIDVESIYEYNSQIENDCEFEFEKIDYVCPVLFIQMELCDFTLKDYLLTWSHNKIIHTNNFMELQKNTEYFSCESEFDSFNEKINIVIQIINGLLYLDSKNIIHRDIKPDNIFLIKNNILNESKSKIEYMYNVKIGDFGLCKKFKSSFEKKILDDEIKSDDLIYNTNLDNIIIGYSYKSMESYVGTGIYRAPEIEEKNYNSKIDIYSLGIIIIELFINFKTQSEKIMLITKLKKNSHSNMNLLNSINNDKLIKLIFSMLNPNPNNRPKLEIILSKLYDCMQDL